MFRIQDNLDGTTSIYCRKNNNLLCTIPGKGNSIGPRRVNVVEPQRAAQSDWQPVDPHNDDQSAHLKEDKGDDKLLPTRASLCRLSPIPIFPPRERREERAEVTPDQFARCLDLVPHHLTDRSEWPLRLISRSGHFRSTDCTPPRDVKIPDNLPLTSLMGMRLLGGNPRHVAGEERALSSLRSYESFCRHPYNTACPTSCHFPKLRCREKREYPVVTASRILRHAPRAHTYALGRRQRRERERTLRIGLDANSRRLLRLCNARTCVVDVTRLSEEVIQDWLSRRSPPSDDDDEPGGEDSDPTYRPTSRRVTHRPKTKRMTRVSLRRCSVYVRDIVMDIQRSKGSHYVKRTNIRVPFFRDFLASRRTNRPLLNAAFQANGIVPAVEQARLSEDRVWRKSKSSLALGSSGSLLGEGSGKERRVVVKHWTGQPALSTGENRQKKREGQTIARRDRPCAAANPKPLVLDVEANSSVLKQFLRHPSSSKGREKKHQASRPVTPKKSEPLLIDLTEETTPPRPSVVKDLSLILLGASPRTTGGTLSGGPPSRTTGGASSGRPPPRSTGGTSSGGPPSRITGAASSSVSPGGRFLVSQWRFQCFACNLCRTYSGRPQMAEDAVRDHMHSYHFVSDTESFLSRYLDSVNHCMVIEAFPGFKGCDE